MSHKWSFSQVIQWSVVSDLWIMQGHLLPKNKLSQNLINFFDKFDTWDNLFFFIDHLHTIHLIFH